MSYTSLTSSHRQLLSSILICATFVDCNKPLGLARCRKRVIVVTTVQLSLTRPDFTRATQGLYTRVKDSLGTQKKKERKANNMQEQRNTRKIYYSK